MHYDRSNMTRNYLITVEAEYEKKSCNFGFSCVGGFVQLVSGLDSIPRARDAQICGANERYAPPIVVFEDRGAATLIFQ